MLLYFILYCTLFRKALAHLGRRVFFLDILISNDDGYMSTGIVCLAQELSKIAHKVTTVAPDRNRSAASSSLTLENPIRVSKDTQKITPTVTHKPIKVQRHLQEESFEYALSDFAGEINTSTSDEVLSFRGNGIQQRLFKKLRHGQIPVEARLDLHGLTVEPAREILSHFITDCLSQQYMCVIIVHGKGSRGDLPVLKTMLNHWLKQIPDILAYSSAQPQDGGTGALYVLLKNKQKMNTL